MAKMRSDNTTLMLDNRNLSQLKKDNKSDKMEVFMQTEEDQMSPAQMTDKIEQEKYDVYIKDREKK